MPGPRIAGAHEGVGEAEHVITIGLGDPDDVGDEVHREPVGDVGHEVDLAVARVDHVEDLLRALHHEIVETADHLRREPGGDQLAELGVRRRVGVHQRLAALQLRGRREHRAVERREPLPVAAHLEHLGVTQHRPERHRSPRPVELHLGVTQHRAPRTQVGEQLVREAGAVEVAVGEVDVERGHGRHARTAGAPA